DLLERGAVGQQRQAEGAAEGVRVTEDPRVVVGVHDGDGLTGPGVGVVGVVVGVELAEAVAGADLRGRVDHRGHGPRFQLLDLEAGPVARAKSTAGGDTVREPGNVTHGGHSWIQTAMAREKKVTSS